MTYVATLAAVKATMLTVTNIGNVYDYVRWYKDWPAMLSLFKVTSPSTQIRFWDISRVST